ncbi:MAG: hypothetical protein ACREBG_23785 [Pyrinomonadaceae bacterium]
MLKQKYTGASRVTLRISIALMLMVGGILLFAACPGPAVEGRILVPVRVCVVKGARLTQQGELFSDVGNDKIDTLMNQAIKDLNTKVWIQGANIQFYTALYQPLGGLDFNAPVIADPHPQGRLGEIDVGDIGFQHETQEMEDAHQACLNAWSLGENGKKTGTIVIIARSTVNFAGRNSSNGVAPGHFKNCPTQQRC